MSKQTVNLGTAPTGAGGDDSRSAMVKINSNFDEIYGAFGGTTIAIVGTVSTGAIIESGSVANGYYVKYADGTMICTQTASGSVTTSSASGSLFYSAGQAWTFPQAFIAAPVVNCSASASGAVIWAGEVAGGTTTTATSFYIVNGANQTLTAVRRMTAIGRWKV